MEIIKHLFSALFFDGNKHVTEIHCIESLMNHCHSVKEIGEVRERFFT